MEEGKAVNDGKALACVADCAYVSVSAGAEEASEEASEEA
jgi:hypothetical protein